MRTRLGLSLLLATATAGCGVSGPPVSGLWSERAPPPPPTVSPRPPLPTVAAQPAAASAPRPVPPAQPFVSLRGPDELPPQPFVPLQAPPPGMRAAVAPAAPDAQIAPAAQPVQAATPDAERRARYLIQQYPWVTQFWAELQGEDRARAERALRRRGGDQDPASQWDRMGLQDRVVLLFGPGRSAN